MTPSGLVVARVAWGAEPRVAMRQPQLAVPSVVALVPEQQCRVLQLE